MERSEGGRRRVGREGPDDARVPCGRAAWQTSIYVHGDGDGDGDGEVSR